MSAPSLTTTRPASGSPASSCRAPSSAVPIASARRRTSGRRRGAEPGGRRREPERTHDESIRERLSSADCGVANFWRAKFARGCLVPVRDLHAPRVVYQDAEEVLLRHRRLDDEHRPEEAEEHQRAGWRVRIDRQHDAMPRRALRPAPRDTSGTSRAIATATTAAATYEPGRRHETELSLLEDHRSVIEEQPKQRLEQCSFSHPGTSSPDPLRPRSRGPRCPAPLRRGRALARRTLRTSSPDPCRPRSRGPVAPLPP